MVKVVVVVKVVVDHVTALESDPIPSIRFNSIIKIHLRKMTWHGKRILMLVKDFRCISIYFHHSFF